MPHSLYIPTVLILLCSCCMVDSNVSILCSCTLCLSIKLSKNLYMEVPNLIITFSLLYLSHMTCDESDYVYNISVVLV